MRISNLLPSLLLLVSGVAGAADAPPFPWTAYGGDGRGQRHAPLGQITPDNVGQLALAWSFRTGELGEGFARAGDALTFEATPLLVGDTLYFNTATGKVFALDAANGRARWTFDAQVDSGRDYSEMATRGVSWWRDPQAAAEIAKKTVMALIFIVLFLSESCFDQVALSLAETGSQPRISFMLGLEILQAEKDLGFLDRGDRTFDLNVIAERKFVQHDLDGTKLPCITVFLVNEYGIQTKLRND